MFSGLAMGDRLVSCLMVTQASRWKDGPPVGFEAFRRQTHEPRELVLLTQDPHPAMDEVGVDVNVRPRDWKLGRLRQAALELASGEYVATWDDDDDSAADRLQVQLEALEGVETSDACTLLRVVVEDVERGRKFIGPRLAWPQTMVARRISMPTYRSEVATGEDSEVIAKMRTLVVLDRPELYTYRIHGSNVAAQPWWAEEAWQKRTGDWGTP